MELSITEKAYLKSLEDKIILRRMQSNFGKRLEDLCMNHGLCFPVSGGVVISTKGREVAKTIKGF